MASYIVVPCSRVLFSIHEAVTNCSVLQSPFGCVSYIEKSYIM